MTAYYLAARFSRHAEMREYRAELAKYGNTVTSRWIDLHGGDQLESAAQSVLNTNPGSVAHFGANDLADIEAADALISFTSDDGGGKGGRHVEHGYALALRKQVIVIGPRENIFHTLPRIWHFPTWADFRPYLFADQPCQNCGRDNRNGTHAALERFGHLSHSWAPATDEGPVPFDPRRIDAEAQR